VWKRQQTWFWSLPDHNGGGGTIGATANEAEAIREACLLIDEIAAQQRQFIAATADGVICSAARSELPHPPALVAFGWLAWWASLASYVNDTMLNEWADVSTRSKACCRC
jgi:hypothetical protein